MPAVGDQHRLGPPGTFSSNAPGCVTANPFEEPPRRISEYTAQEIATLQARLDKQLGPEYISSRPGAAGQKVHYLAAEKCINLANEVFGFNGWSSAIQNIQIDFVDESQHTGKISLGLSVIVRVTLKDGTYHEDIGYGHIENCKGKAAAFEKAKKEGTTDALKRALRTFGNVLGNCIYDKEYLARVTRVKVGPTKWDVDNLHRHPDYAPVKKEPEQTADRSKNVSEDNDLPPRPTEVSTRNNNDITMTFDGDGEFGSDLFDEADFVATATGLNPDEVVLDEPSKQEQSTPRQVQPAQQRPQENFSRPPARPPADAVTPSKPGNAWTAGAQRQQPQMPQTRQNGSATTQQPHMQRRPVPVSMQQQQQPPQNARTAHQAPLRSSQDASSHTSGGQAAVKQEASNNNNPANNKAQNNDTSQDMHPPGSSPTPGNNQPADPPSVFYSARAVDMLRENPQAAALTAPQFDPHSESPSIRKTAGVDHNKSVPITKPMIAGASPAANNTRDFINPSAEMHRRIGAPGGGGGGFGSPMGRGQSTSSFRPLTRPSIDPRNVGAGNNNNNNAAVPNNRGPPGLQNANGKRPPLGDVTNAPPGPGGTGATMPTSGPGDPKRPRMSNEGNNISLPQQQQQQQPQH